MLITVALTRILLCLIQCTNVTLVQTILRSNNGTETILRSNNGTETILRSNNGTETILRSTIIYLDEQVIKYDNYNTILWYYYVMISVLA
jgi:hypothetical protein